MALLQHWAGRRAQARSALGSIGLLSALLGHTLVSPALVSPAAAQTQCTPDGVGFSCENNGFDPNPVSVGIAIASTSDVVAPASLRNFGTIGGPVSLGTAIAVNGVGTIESVQSIDNFGEVGADVSMGLAATVTGIGDISGVQSIRSFGDIDGSVSVGAAATVDGIGDIDLRQAMDNFGLVDGDLTLGIAATVDGIGSINADQSLANSGTVTDQVTIGMAATGPGTLTQSFLNTGTLGDGVGLVINSDTGNSVSTSQSFFNSGAIADETLVRTRVDLDGIGDIDIGQSVVNRGTMNAMLTVSTQALVEGIGNIALRQSVVNNGTINGNVPMGGQAVIGPNSIGDIAWEMSLVNRGQINGGVLMATDASINGIGDIVATQTLTNFGRIDGQVLMIASASVNGFDVPVVQTITNHGVIDGGGLSAIEMSFGPSVMTSVAGSRVIGLIELGTGADQANFLGGNYHFTFDDLSAATVDAAGAPFVVSGNEVFVYDPTAIGQEDRILSDLADVLGDLTEGRFDGAAPGLSWIEAAGQNHAVWASAFLSGRGDDGLNPGFGSWSRLTGGVLGIDFAVGPDLTIGILGGGALGTLSVEGKSQRVESDYFFVGLYGRLDRGAMFIHTDLVGGFATNDSTRLVANNMVPGGVETATASYDSWFLSPEIVLGWNHVRPSGLMLTPALKIRYLAGRLDGYSDTGSSANVVVGERFAHALEGRAELAISPERPVVFGGTEIDYSARIGAVAAGRFGEDVDILFAGQGFAVSQAVDDFLFGGYVGGSLDILLGGTWSLFSAAEGTLWSDGSLVGHVSGGLKAGF